jgi:hypothetical protein
LEDVAKSYAYFGRNAEALQLREQVFAICKAKLGADHSDTLASMGAIAESLIQLDRGAEALSLIDNCLRRAVGKTVDCRLIPEVIDLRLRYFAKTKDTAGCRATAEMWENLMRTDANSLYTAACMRAVTAAVIKADPKIAKADATLPAQEEADKAMAWLQQAVAAGYQNAKHIKADQDLNPLRDRDDFRKLVQALEIKN